MNNVKLENAKRIFFIALCLDITVTALVLAGDIWAIGIVNDIRAGGTANEAIHATAAFWDTFSKVVIFTTIGVGWTLTAWLGACYEYAREGLKVTGFKHASWTTWGWIIPVFNVFKPYQVLSEIYKVGSSDFVDAESWRKSSTSGLLIVWWIGWLIAHLVIFSLSKTALSTSLQEGPTVNEILKSYYGSAAACIISVTVAGVWFMVAGGITRRLLARNKAMNEINNLSVMSPSSEVGPVAIERDAQQSTRQTARGVDANFDEDAAYLQIANEIASEAMDRGLWLKALVKSNGTDTTKQTIAYTEFRLHQMRAAWRSVDREVPVAEPELNVEPDNDHKAIHINWREEVPLPRVSSGSDQIQAEESEVSAVASASYKSGTPWPKVAIFLLLVAVIFGVGMLFSGEKTAAVALTPSPAPPAAPARADEVTNEVQSPPKPNGKYSKSPIDAPRTPTIDDFAKEFLEKRKP